MSETEEAPKGQPSEEELRAALEEQMRKIQVSDVLLQTAVTLVNLGARRLGVAGDQEAEDQDLGQAKLAIDGVRALLPLLPDDQAAPVKDAVSQLQIAFAQAAGGNDASSGAAPPDTPPGDPPAADPPAAAEPPAKEGSRIWTPPGT